MYAIDKFQVCKRFDGASNTYDSVADVQRDSAKQLVEFALQHAPNTRINSALDIGAGTGYVTKILHAKLPCTKGPKQRVYTLNDISSNMLDRAKFNLQNFAAAHVRFLLGDMEQLEFDNHDLVISNFALQWANNLNYMIKKLYNSSNKILAFSSLLNGTFAQWHRACSDYSMDQLRENSIERYPDENQILGCIQACNAFNYQYKIQEFEVNFDNIQSFLRYIKQLGASYNVANICINSLKKVLSNNSAPFITKYRVFFGILIK